MAGLSPKRGEHVGFQSISHPSGISFPPRIPWIGPLGLGAASHPCPLSFILCYNQRSITARVNSEVRRPLSCLFFFSKKIWSALLLPINNRKQASLPGLTAFASSKADASSNFYPTFAGGAGRQASCRGRDILLGRHARAFAGEDAPTKSRGRRKTLLLGVLENRPLVGFVSRSKSASTAAGGSGWRGWRGQLISAYKAPPATGGGADVSHDGGKQVPVQPGEGALPEASDVW